MSSATARTAIEAFFKSDAYAVVGVSADRRKFGNAAYRTLKEKEFVVFPVHPHLSSVENDACFATVLELPGEVKSVVTVIPPPETLKVVEQCAAKGVTSIWMQQGSQSPEAIARAQKLGMTVVHGECIMMFLEPVKSVHALHRFLKKLVGAYPG